MRAHGWRKQVKQVEPAKASTSTSQTTKLPSLVDKNKAQQEQINFLLEKLIM